MTNYRVAVSFCSFTDASGELCSDVDKNKINVFRRANQFTAGTKKLLGIQLNELDGNIIVIKTVDN